MDWSAPRAPDDEPEKPRQRRSARRNVWTGLLGVAAVLTVLCGPAVGIASASELLTLLGATFAVLVLHESGHLIAALACGFEVTAIKLGILRLWKKGRGWGAQLSASSVFSGGVTAYPRGNEHWRAKMLCVVGAGPLATLGSALLVHAGMRLGLVSANAGWAFVEMSGFILIMGLAPNAPNAAAPNDAALFVALCRDREDANAIFLYHLVLQQQRVGREPGEYPRWLIHLIATFQGRRDFMAVYAGLVAAWCFEHGDREAADGWDDRALRLSAACGDGVRYVCLANSACFDLGHRGDVPAARAKLAELRPESLAAPSIRHRVFALRGVLNGEIRKCLAEISAARDWLPRHQQNSGWEHSLLRGLHRFATTSRRPL